MENGFCVAVLVRCGLRRWITYRSEVVILRVWEVLEVGKKRKPKPSTADTKTDWEKNLTGMRSRKRQFNAEKPIKPVKTD